MLALPAARRKLVLVRTMYHYARATAFARKKDIAAAQAETDAIAALEGKADFKPYEPWGVPAKEIVDTARLVAIGRIADAAGDLERRREGLRRGGALEDKLELHRAAVLVLPGASVARRRAPAPGPARRRRARVPRFARQRAQQRLGARRAGRGVQAQGRQNGETAAQRAYAKAWFGPAGGPDLGAALGKRRGRAARGREQLKPGRLASKQR